MTNPALMTIGEVAEYLGFEYGTVRLMVYDHELPTIWDGKRIKVPRYAVQCWLEEWPGWEAEAHAAVDALSYYGGESTIESKPRPIQRGRNTPGIYTAERRARRLQATPSWADQEAIAFFYRYRPKGMHVDHIVPLQGKNVCGLHVETNLQWLAPSQNSRKRNKWDG